MSQRALTYIAIAVVAALLFGAVWNLLISPGAEVRLRITTTTSLYATGLLDVLSEEFQEKYPNVRIEFIPVGSGEALRRAAQGDACVVFVHAPNLERKYVEQGVIGDRVIFAYNYFVVVGPSDDPAGVSGAESPVEAFRRIYEAGEAGRALFVSRGDNSGTHNKELSIWRKANLNPQGKGWYMESGQGMDATLVIAEERRAYTLSDISTFLKLKKEGRLPGLEVLYAGGEELLNIYSAYIVSSCTGREREYAVKLLEYLSGEAQDVIEAYGVDEFGRPLFNPARGRLDWLREEWQRLAEG